MVDTAWDDCPNSDMFTPNLSNQQIEYVHVDPYRLKTSKDMLE
jgi:hypothetical protein